MPDRYPPFLGGSQICGQSAPPVKATNGEKLKMLNCKFAFFTCGWSPIKKWKKTNPIRNWKKNYGNKSAIFVLKTFLCIIIPNAHCAPEGTKKTCIKIHQQLCQKNYIIFLLWKLYWKLDCNALVFAKKNQMDVLRLYMVCIILMT